MPVSSQPPNAKSMLKLPWALLKVNLRILDLIGRETTYFVQNMTTIVLHVPCDSRRTTRELPSRTGADPGFFLGGEAPLRNDVTDRRGIQILREYEEESFISGCGGAYPLHPPPRSAQAGKADPFVAPNVKLEDTRCFMFFTFYNLITFWELKIPFCKDLMPSPVSKVARFQFLSCKLTMTSGQYSFPA